MPRASKPLRLRSGRHTGVGDARSGAAVRIAGLAHGRGRRWLAAASKKRARAACAHGAEVGTRTGCLRKSAARASRRRRRVSTTATRAGGSASVTRDGAREARSGAATGTNPVARAAPGAAAPGFPTRSVAAPVAAARRTRWSPSASRRARNATAKLDDHLPQLVDLCRQGGTFAASIARRPTAALWHGRRGAGGPLGRVVRREALARRCHPKPRPGFPPQAPGPPMPSGLPLALGSRGCARLQRAASPAAGEERRRGTAAARRGRREPAARGGRCARWAAGEQQPHWMG